MEICEKLKSIRKVILKGIDSLIENDADNYDKIDNKFDHKNLAHMDDQMKSKFKI